MPEVITSQSEVETKNWVDPKVAWSVTESDEFPHSVEGIDQTYLNLPTTVTIDGVTWQIAGGNPFQLRVRKITRENGVN